MYQSSNFRRAQQPQPAGQEKYRSQAQQLQELFTSWSNEDLQSVLEEVNGNVELAAARISEGHAQQWGSVNRKKDKKAPSSPATHQSKESLSHRGDFRGGRGGRGGRGSPGRGGAARGSFSRGGHREVNGHTHKSSEVGETAVSKSAAEEVAVATPGEGAADGSTLSAASVAWGEPASETPSAAAPFSPSAWGTSTPSTWGGQTAANGTSSPAVPQRPLPAKVVAKQPATPATVKKSWAQIARPQEKPTPLPAPVPAPAPPAVASAPVQAPAPSAPAPQPEPTVPSFEPPSEPAQTGWEEPTTVQEPAWHDEPAPAPEPVPETAQEEHEVPEVEVLPEAPAAIVEPAAVSAIPEQLQPHAPEPKAAAVAKPLTPAAHTRPGSAALRAKFKTDQAVVMPSTSFGTVEKVGMQFGSLSLGDDVDSSLEPPAAEKAQLALEPIAAIGVPEPAKQPEPVKQPEQLAPAPVSAPVPVPKPESPIVATLPTPPSQPPQPTTPALFQSAIPQQAQHQQHQQPPQPSPQPLQPQHSLPSSFSQPAISSQTQAPPQSQPSIPPSASSVSSISQYSQGLPPQSISSHQLPQAQSQQNLPSQHLTYGQHGLPSHLEPVQNQSHSPSLPQAQQQQQNLSGPSYFRQPEQPYFHAPTPPVGGAQDSPYGAFGQLSQQHQGQGSHLGSFGGEYGYNDSQRNFYDSYNGPSGFGGRGVLGHDDIKGLPGAQQQPHGAPGLPPATSQASQQLPPSSQTSSQGGPNAGQGPQQSYPPPLPYYYPYPQNQYYGSPYNSGYTVQPPFVKYPAVFQGPPGPQSAPSPAAKQGPSAATPHSPYTQSLYGQQHASGAYDDIPYQHHSHGQSVGGGLPQGDYGKSLYSASNQGMQGFMGLGQSTGPSSGPPISQRAGGASPEAAFKPYGSNVGVKEVGAGVGVGVGQSGVGQGPQGRSGVQQPGQGGFYGAQRFGASASAVPQSQQAQQHQPQSQGPQGHMGGYPQGVSDAGQFYSYQQRQQQGYWQ